MKTRAENSINQYAELYHAIKGKIDNDDVAIAIMQEIGKDRRAGEIAAHAEKESATEKQKKLLKSLGIECSDAITKKEASHLLAERLGKS